jgi:hypothetical protein
MFWGRFLKASGGISSNDQVNSHFDYSNQGKIRLLQGELLGAVSFYAAKTNLIILEHFYAYMHVCM